MRAVLVALASVAVVVSTSGCGHGPGSSLPQLPRSYSEPQVKAAFAAAGLPLKEIPMPPGSSEYFFLSSPAYVDVGIRFSVTVNPPEIVTDEFAWSAVGDGPSKDIDASATGNVVVVFDRRSPSAPTIRAALARLRRM